MYPFKQPQYKGDITKCEEVQKRIAAVGQPLLTYEERLKKLCFSNPVRKSKRESNCPLPLPVWGNKESQTLLREAH